MVNGIKFITKYLMWILIFINKGSTFQIYLFNTFEDETTVNNELLTDSKMENGNTDSYSKTQIKRNVSSALPIETYNEEMNDAALINTNIKYHRKSNRNIKRTSENLLNKQITISSTKKNNKIFAPYKPRISCDKINGTFTIPLFFFKEKNINKYFRNAWMNENSTTNSMFYSSNDFADKQSNSTKYAWIMRITNIEVNDNDLEPETSHRRRKINRVIRFLNIWRECDTPKIPFEEIIRDLNKEKSNITRKINKRRTHSYNSSRIGKIFEDRETSITDNVNYQYPDLITQLNNNVSNFDQFRKKKSKRTSHYETIKEMKDNYEITSVNSKYKISLDNYRTVKELQLNKETYSKKNKLPSNNARFIFRNNKLNKKVIPNNYWDDRNSQTDFPDKDEYNLIYDNFNYYKKPHTKPIKLSVLSKSYKPRTVNNKSDFNEYLNSDIGNLMKEITLSVDKNKNENFSDVSIINEISYSHEINENYKIPTSSKYTKWNESLYDEQNNPNNFKKSSDLFSKNIESNVMELSYNINNHSHDDSSTKPFYDLIVQIDQPRSNKSEYNLNQSSKESQDKYKNDLNSQSLDKSSTTHNEFTNEIPLCHFSLSELYDKADLKNDKNVVNKIDSRTRMNRCEIYLLITLIALGLTIGILTVIVCYKLFKYFNERNWSFQHLIPARYLQNTRINRQRTEITKPTINSKYDKDNLKKRKNISTNNQSDMSDESPQFTDASSQILIDNLGSRRSNETSITSIQPNVTKEQMMKQFDSLESSTDTKTSLTEKAMKIGKYLRGFKKVSYKRKCPTKGMEFIVDENRKQCPHANKPFCKCELSTFVEL